MPSLPIRPPSISNTVTTARNTIRMTGLMDYGDEYSLNPEKAVDEDEMIDTQAPLELQSGLSILTPFCLILC
jgi:hypothetical protein